LAVAFPIPDEQPVTRTDEGSEATRSL
jgi:hypothetical protein